MGSIVYLKASPAGAIEPTEHSPFGAVLADAGLALWRSGWLTLQAAAHSAAMVSGAAYLQGLLNSQAAPPEDQGGVDLEDDKASSASALLAARWGRRIHVAPTLTEAANAPHDFR